MSGPLPGNSRDLVTQGFATSGGHQNQGVAASHYAVNDGFLRPPERSVAENLAQNVFNRQDQCY
jgi:hypothetical protein